MLTGAGFAPGEFVSLRVTHAVGIPDTGEGHGEWTVVADGDGGFVTTWHVCEDDCIGETLLAMATGQTSGLSASVLFTDSAGSYTLKWYAADPEVNRAPFFPTYPKLEPVELPCPAPSGGSGIASNPLLNAYAYATPPIPSNLDAVTSLMPKDMALCQIAPFFVEITVTGSTAPENGIINFNPEWLTKTTSGKDFGFDPAYGVYCAFVDQAEPGTVDPEGDAKVLAYSSTTLGVGTANERIRGAIQVSGLDDGDKVFVEIWVVLKCTVPTDVNGNVQTSLVNAHTGMTESGSNIQLGNQTVPLLQVGDFFNVVADVSVTKSSSPVCFGQNITYTMVVTNNSTTTVANGIVATDTMGPDQTFVSASGAPYTTAGQVVTFNVGALSPGESATLTLVATPTVTGSVTNAVAVTMITSDSNLANNTASVTTAVNAGPPCSINGPETMCPNSAGNVYSAPPGMSSYSWSISGNGTIVGSTTDQSVSVTAGSACGSSFTLTVNVATPDACSGSCSATFNVADTNPPLIAGVGGPSSIECPATPVFSTPTASDDCDPNPLLSFNDVRTPGSCPAEYVLTRTWTATDACGNTSSASQAITVEDNTAPVITGVGGPATIECPATPVFSEPTAFDPCDPNVVLSFNDVTTPGSCPAEYSLTRTWTATDACGNSSSASQSITVEDNTAPVIEGVGGPLTIECPASPVFSEPTASDLCDSNPVLSFNDVRTPGSCPAEYSLTRTWTATDACGNSSSASQTITVEDTTAPVISGVGGPLTIECPATPVFSTPTAFDPCDPNVVLSFNDVTTPGSCPAEYSLTRTWTRGRLRGNSITASQTITVEDTTAPVISGVGANATIECPATPVFSTPTAFDPCDPNVVLSFNDVTTPGSCPAEYSLTRTWSAVDCAGNSITASQTITVEDTTAPVITGVGGPLTIECPATPVFSTPTASDLCDTNPVLSFNDVRTPGSCPAEYALTRTWTATDACGNSSSASQTILVKDTTAPVIEGVGGPLTIECPASPVFSEPTASDLCDTNPVLSFNDVRTPGSCPAEYALTRTWTATDACGNSSSASQTILVKDTTAPVIEGVGGPLTIECPASPVFSEPTASDLCDTNPVLSFNDVRTPGSCPAEYALTRTWTATDACGNSSSASQTILVKDTTAPVIEGVGGPLTIECPASPVFSEPTASDLCDSNPVLSFDDVRTPGSCPAEYSLTRTWTATDACGNSSSASQTILVKDTTAPVITGVGGPETIECPANPMFSTPTASDLCDTNPVLSFNDVRTPGSCPAEYSLTRTWTATDACGNSSSASQTILVKDTTAPVITGVGGPLTIECPANPMFSDADGVRPV